MVYKKYLAPQTSRPAPEDAGLAERTKTSAAA